QLTPPNEPINPLRPAPNSRGISGVTRHGLKSFQELFTPRQLLCLLTCCAIVREATRHMRGAPLADEHVKAVAAYLGLTVDRLADWNSSLCAWSPEKTGGAKIGH